MGKSIDKRTMEIARARNRDDLDGSVQMAIQSLRSQISGLYERLQELESNIVSDYDSEGDRADQPAHNTAQLTNKSGASRNKGDVVILDTSNDKAFATTTSANSEDVIGVVLSDSTDGSADAVAADALGLVCIGGRCKVNVDADAAAISRGDYLTTHTTACYARKATDEYDAGIFARALEAKASGTGTISCLVFKRPKRIWNLDGTDVKLVDSWNIDLAAGDITTTGDLNVANIVATGNITMPEDGWIGIGAAAVRFIFDGSEDRVILRGGDLVVDEAVAVSGNMVLGSSDPTDATNAFTMISEDSYVPMAAYKCRDAGDGPLLLYKKSRGTFDSPAIVQDEDVTGGIIGQAYDGSNYQYSAAIRMYVDGMPGANDTPGKIIFETVADGTAALVERVSLIQNGKMTIGYKCNQSTNADEQLHISPTSQVSGGIAYVLMIDNGDNTTGDEAGIRFRAGTAPGSNRSKGLLTYKSTTTYGRGSFCFYQDMASDVYAVTNADTKVLEIKTNGDVDIPYGNLQVNSTTMIDSSGYITPITSADGDAPNNSIYYSSTQSKLVYKDSGGTVNDLY